ncbi:MAG: hypothetical protein ABSB40_10985 [Nitrososphaeria archaeon]
MKKKRVHWLEKKEPRSSRRIIRRYYEILKFLALEGPLNAYQLANKVKHFSRQQINRDLAYLAKGSLIQRVELQQKTRPGAKYYDVKEEQGVEAMLYFQHIISFDDLIRCIAKRGQIVRLFEGTEGLAEELKDISKFVTSRSYIWTVLSTHFPHEINTPEDLHSREYRTYDDDLAYHIYETTIRDIEFSLLIQLILRDNQTIKERIKDILDKDPKLRSAILQVIEEYVSEYIKFRQEMDDQIQKMTKIRDSLN